MLARAPGDVRGEKEIASQQNTHRSITHSLPFPNMLFFRILLLKSKVRFAAAAAPARHIQTKLSGGQKIAQKQREKNQLLEECAPRA